MEDLRVTVSVPCPDCADPARPRPGCPRCGGDGIVLLKVRPADAARPAEELLRDYPLPEPGRG